MTKDELAHMERRLVDLSAEYRRSSNDLIQFRYMLLHSLWKAARREKQVM